MPSPSPTPVPCVTYKTVYVAYTAPDIAPLYGYKVKWRLAGETTWNAVANQYNNPISIANIPACNNLEVSVQADCGNGSVGQEIIVAIPGNSTTCYTFILTDVATYSYTPCGGTSVSTVNNTSAESPLSICAKDGSVSGGAFTRSGTCGS